MSKKYGEALVYQNIDEKTRTRSRKNVVSQCRDASESGEVEPCVAGHRRRSRRGA